MRQQELNDAQYMGRALELAARGVGTTFPNPRVGCVVVKDGAIVGEGFHRKAGEPHAEVLALKAAGEKARGATVYVNLEPCSHRGRTGPCADALVEAGVAAVVAAIDDPNPKVAGKGFGRLDEARIAVRKGILADEARRLNEAFLYAAQTGRPLLHLKWATTLDGKSGPPQGGRHDISGAEARRWVHGLRAESDAVLVGGETLRIDDPQLTVRDFAWSDGRELRQPARIIATNRPVDMRKRVFEPGVRRIVLFGREPGQAQLDALEREGVEATVVPGPDGLHWERALAFLGESEFRSVLVEAGPSLAGELLRRRLVQRVSVIVSPRILGGAGSRPSVAGMDPETMSDALRLREVETSRLGDDILITGVPTEAARV